MRPYHIACRSTDLDKMIITKANRRIVTYDICNHCNRIIEPYEINNSIIALRMAISKGDIKKWKRQD